MAEGLYQRVGEAVRRGEMWRAKEMLRGNIGSGSYDSELYERYGTLLMELGELVEAGKYLFLSGRRRPEYDQAIGTYLSRHPEDRPEVLYYSFPSAARFPYRQTSRYPLEVRRTLDERGLPQYFAKVQQQRRAKRKFERAEGDTLSEPHIALLRRRVAYGRAFPTTLPERGLRLLRRGLMGIAILFLAVSTVVGAVTIVLWLTSLA